MAVFADDGVFFAVCEITPLLKFVCALVLLIAIGNLVATPVANAQGDLIDASEAGDLSRVKELLAAVADVNARSAMARPP